MHWSRKWSRRPQTKHCVLSVIKEGVFLGFRSSEFSRVSSRFHSVPFEVLPVSMHPVGSSLLSCESSEMSPELDPVDRPGF